MISNNIISGFRTEIEKMAFQPLTMVRRAIGGYQGKTRAVPLFEMAMGPSKKGIIKKLYTGLKSRKLNIEPKKDIVSRAGAAAKELATIPLYTAPIIAGGIGYGALKAPPPLKRVY